MNHTFETTRRVQFADTDMAGIVHFSNFFRFMEEVEHAFFRSLGFTLHGDDGAGGMNGWARVRATCDYLRPARYPELLAVRLVVREKTSRSLSYAIEFRTTDEATGAIAPDPIARGELVVVHVARANGGALRAATMPEDVSSAISVAPDGGVRSPSNP